MSDINMAATTETDADCMEVGMVTVYNFPGAVLATVSPVPPSVRELKIAISEQISVPPGLQKLVEHGGCHIYEDNELLKGESLSVVMVTDESAMFSWDVDGNPNKDHLQLETASILTCPNLRSDYCNVLTKEPITQGVHYFEFVMHYIGDEQWCGVVSNPKQAGTRFSGRSLTAWTYYAGRVGSRHGSIRDGKGALHAEGRAVVQFTSLNRTGDIIGMLVDMVAGAIAFDLNGELQGACAIPTDKPLYVLTHMDTPKDRVELRKPCLMDAPPANLEAMKNALLNIKSGEKLNSWGCDSSDSDSHSDCSDSTQRF